jgi:uncharacterized membrane protein
VGGGILMAAISLIANPTIGIIASGLILLFMIITPIIYSYKLYKNQNIANK